MKNSTALHGSADKSKRECSQEKLCCPEVVLDVNSSLEHHYAQVQLASGVMKTLHAGVELHFGLTIICDYCSVQESR